MNPWEIWFAEFPFEDNPSIIKPRPVIVLDVNVEPIRVLSVKVTTHNPRTWDKYDTPIVHWQEAGLDRPSVARVAKSMFLTPDQFVHKIGFLHVEDQGDIYKQYITFVRNQQ